MSGRVTRDAFMVLFHSDGTLRQCANMMSLTDEEVGAALLEARFNKMDRINREALTTALSNAVATVKPVTDSGKVWCDQCQSLVRTQAIVACRQRFCSVKAAA